MGVDKSGSTYRGLLIPDPRVTFKGTFKADLSTMTEAGPRVGVPRATVDTNMILQTSGDQSAAGDIRIESQYSGHPKNNGGAFLWHNGADTATLKHRGWEPPWTVTGMEVVKSAQVGRQRAVNFDVLTTDNDTLVAVGIHPTTAGATASDPWEILCWSKAPAASVWTETQIAQDSDLSEGAAIQSARIDGWGGATANNGPAVLELPDGRIVCFFWVRIFTAYISGANRRFWQIRAHISTDKGATWSLYQENALSDPLEQLHDTAEDHHPGRLRAAYKDGQVLLLATIRDEIASTTPSGFVGTKTGRTIIGQWASSSLGSTFELVEIWEGTEAQSGGFCDVVTHSGKFIVAYVHDPDVQTIEIRKIGSAFQKLSGADRIPVADTAGAGERDGGSAGSGAAPNYLDRGELSLTRSPDGNLYLCYVRLGYFAPTISKQIATIQVSYNGGDAWEDVGGAWDAYAGSNWDAGDGGFMAANYDFGTAPKLHIRDRLRHIAATWQRGRLVLLTSYDGTDPGATPGDEQSGVLTEQGTFALYLGGYSTLTLGSTVGTAHLERRANYREHWFPFTHPEATGDAWTKTTGGTQTATLNDDANDQPYLELVSGDGAGATGQIYYDDSAIARPATLDTVSVAGHTMRLHAEWALDVISGGATVASGVAIRFRVGRPGAGEIFAVRYKGDGTIAIYDENAAAALHTSTLANVGLAYPAAFRLATYDRKVALFAQAYRANDTDRLWVKVYESANAELSEAAAALRDCEIQFGHIATGGGATINKSRWYYVQAGAHNDAAGPVCAVPQVNDWFGYSSPDDCGPRFYSGSALYVNDGAKIAAKDGPTVRGDVWKLQTRYDFGIENVHHEISASPAKTWRSSSTATEAIIRWDIDANAAAWTPGPVIGLYLGNVNFRHAVFQAYDQTGAWVDLATIDTRIQVHYLRKGNTIRPDTSLSTHTSPHYHTYNSLSGSHFVFNPAAAGANPDPFQISGNTEGVFSNTAGAATSKLPILRLGGDVSTMPASGDGEIWARNVLTVVHVQNTTQYQRYRLKIPAGMPTGTTLNGTAEGYWEIGNVIIGHVAAFGRQYARGHIRQLAPNSDMQTQRGGTRRATRLGPARRSVEFAWADSIDLTQMQEGAPAPDYIDGTSHAGVDPLATVSDTAFVMEGIISELDGPVTPVVYLPSLNVTAVGTLTETVLDPNRMLYGRIVSDRFRIENVIGDEWASEVVTASAVRIDEEV